MRLAAMCVVVVTCGLLIVMVLGAAVTDYRRQRARRARAETLEERLRPYEVTQVIDLRPWDEKALEIARSMH